MDAGSAAFVEVALAESDEVVRLDANENRSGVDDRVPMLKDAALRLKYTIFHHTHPSPKFEATHR